MTTLKLIQALRPTPIAHAAALLCGRNIDTLATYREVSRIVSNIPGKRYHFRVAGRCPPEIEIPDTTPVQRKAIPRVVAANDPERISLPPVQGMQAAAHEAMRRTLLGKPK